MALLIAWEHFEAVIAAMTFGLLSYLLGYAMGVQQGMKRPRSANEILDREDEVAVARLRYRGLPSGQESMP